MQLNIVDCGDVITPINGTVTYTNGTTYLSTATTFCNIGYDLLGNSESTCHANGTWSKTNTTCQIKGETYVQALFVAMKN